MYYHLVTITLFAKRLRYLNDCEDIYGASSLLALYPLLRYLFNFGWLVSKFISSRVSTLNSRYVLYTSELTNNTLSATILVSLTTHSLFTLGPFPAPPIKHAFLHHIGRFAFRCYCLSHSESVSPMPLKSYLT